MQLGDINVCTEAMHEHNEYGEGKPQYIDTLRVPPRIVLFNILFYINLVFIPRIISRKFAKTTSEIISVFTESYLFKNTLIAVVSVLPKTFFTIFFKRRLIVFSILEENGI